jgi:hypothetical protein
MTDVTAQNTTPNSYVDDYAPPAQMPQAPMQPSDQPDAPVQPLQQHSDSQDQPPQQDMAMTQGDQNMTPPAVDSGSEVTATPSVNEDSEALEDQNIFDLLGISEAAESEKELFLDELQQVIWEDFVENDVELLLTAEEVAEFKNLTDNPSLSEDERQAMMIDYLEKLIPDLEKIMLEKALDLKEDMTRQRIADMLQSLANSPEKLEQVKQAQQMADTQKWQSVARTLNAIPAA